jgi:hypothetical protein
MIFVNLMKVLAENSFTLTNVMVPISPTDMEHPPHPHKILDSQFSYDLGAAQYDPAFNP